MFCELDYGKQLRGTWVRGLDTVCSVVYFCLFFDYILRAKRSGIDTKHSLNLQHYLWKDTLGFLLHPDIVLPADTTLKIADIGTGTGIWLFDLKSQLPPDAQLHGFDVSDAQFPPSQWVPENIELRAMNPFEALPEEYVDQYDVVHLRLFISMAEDNDLADLIWNIARMLSKSIRPETARCTELISFRARRVSTVG